MLGFGFLTVEALMFFGGGFLVASLLGVLAVAAAQKRTERLTTRRLDAAIPVSVVAMQAEKDQLRAEFASSARRLDKTVDELRQKVGAYADQISKKTKVIEQVRTALDEKSAMIETLEKREVTAVAREKEIFDQLGIAKAETHATNEALREGERVIAGLKTEVAVLTAEIAVRDRTIQRQQDDQKTLNEQLDAFRRNIAAFTKDVRETEVRFHAEPADIGPAANDRDGPPDAGQHGGAHHDAAPLEPAARA